MAVSNNNNPGSWTSLKNGKPVLTSEVGTKGIRDPSLIVAPDRSKFYLICTVCAFPRHLATEPADLTIATSQDLKVNGIGWNSGVSFTSTGSKSIVVWESSDLAHWSGPSLPVVSPQKAGMTWAPDAIWDPKKGQFMVFWTSKIDGVLRTLRSWTSDFKTFTPAESYVNLGMDNTIAFDSNSGKYYMISKNGPGDLIQQNAASSPDGPWSKVAEQIGRGQLPAGEGPLIFQDNANSDKVCHLLTWNPSSSQIY